MNAPTAHPDDDVTPAQRVYNEAFVRWLRSGSNEDRQTKDECLGAMFVEAAIDAEIEEAA